MTLIMIFVSPCVCDERDRKRRSDLIDRLCVSARLSVFPLCVSVAWRLSASELAKSLARILPFPSTRSLELSSFAVDASRLPCSLLHTHTSSLPSSAALMACNTISLSLTTG